jgi:hypothetical protein
MKYLKRSTILVALAALQWLGLSELASAGQAELDALLTQKARPTIRQVIEAAGSELVAKIQHTSNGTNDVMRFRQIEQLPKIIAFMEKAFPGALWAPLGRDAVIFGDLLDAFYLSIGQSGRVSRLNASGGGVKGATSDQLVRFLESAGLDLDNFKKRPFVGIDYTSYNQNSQSFMLLSAAYHAYVAKGGNPKELIPYVNFFALKDLAPNAAHTTDEALSTFFKRDLYYEGLGNIFSIFQLNVGKWTHSEAWHYTFGSLAETPEGRFEATLGQDLPGTHFYIISQMLEIYRRVSAPEFQLAVQKAAGELGYEFPIGKSAIQHTSTCQEVYSNPVAKE